MPDTTTGAAPDGAAPGAAPPAAASTPPADAAARIAALEAELAKERGIKTELIADRDKRKAREREQAQAEADAAKKRGELEPVLKQRETELAEAQRARETAEAALVRLRVGRAIDARLAAAGITPSDITEAYIDRALTAGRVAVDGDKVTGLDEIVAALSKALAPAVRAAPDTGRAAGTAAT